MGSYRIYLIPSKTAALVPEFVVEDLPSAQLQPWFLHFQWMTSPWADHTDDLMIYFYSEEFTMENHKIITINMEFRIYFPDNGCVLTSCRIERENFYPGPGLESTSPALRAGALTTELSKTMAVCWLVVELKEKISILDLGLNPHLQLYVLVL